MGPGVLVDGGMRSDIDVGMNRETIHSPALFRPSPRVSVLFHIAAMRMGIGTIRGNLPRHKPPRIEKNTGTEKNEKTAGRLAG